MAYQKKNLTPEQRSELARKASAARKNKRGGRPKGWTKDPALVVKKQRRSLACYDEDYKIIVKLANVARKTQVEFIHLVAESLKAKNPQVNFDEPIPAPKVNT